MSQALRLQITSFIILSYIIMNYYSAKRRQTISHMIFSILLALSTLNVSFDMAYVVYINRTGMYSDILYRGYMLSLSAVFSTLYWYHSVKIKSIGGQTFLNEYILQIPVAVMFVLVLFTPMRYEYIGKWYKIRGIALYYLIAMCVFYFGVMLVLYIMNYKYMLFKSKLVHVLSLTVIMSVLLIQLIDQNNIISSMAIAFVILCTYAVTENPDVLLIEQLQYERDRANQANISKSSFIANISHEIRTPINAILGMDEMIMRETKEENIRAYSEDIANAAYTLYGIINDVLDMSKMESGNMDIVPVKYELSSVLQELMHYAQGRIDKKGLDFKIDVNPTLPNVYYGDDLRIKQVLINLLSNAIKYTHSGFIRINVDGEYRGELMDLKFTVTDSGIGIKQEDMYKLFVAFERIEESRNRNIAGAGLGLNITNNLLRMMGSKLNVSSVYAEGSSFYFTLSQRIVNKTPIGSLDDVALKKRENYEIRIKAPEVRILVVDDNSLNRRVFMSLLKGTDIHVDEASSGAECLEKIRILKYDLIFLDHLMPEMDGVETIKRIKISSSHLNINTPFVMLTANVDSSYMEEYKRAGFDGYLSKPIFADRLEDILLKFIPAHKLNIGTPDRADEQKSAEEWRSALPMIRGIDWNEAFKHLPTKEILEATLKEFHKSIATEAEALDENFALIENEENLNLFRIKVHALKSSAAMIGAEVLSNGAKEIEEAAKQGNLNIIREKYPYMINYYRTYSEKLAPFDDGCTMKKKVIDFPQVLALVEMVRMEVEEMNKSNALEDIDEIEAYDYPADIQVDINMLRREVEDFEPEMVSVMVDNLLMKLRNLRNKG